MACTLLAMGFDLCVGFNKCDNDYQGSNHSHRIIKIAIAIDILMILGAIIVGALGIASKIYIMPTNVSYLMVGSGSGALVMGCMIKLCQIAVNEPLINKCLKKFNLNTHSPMN